MSASRDTPWRCVRAFRFTRNHPIDIPAESFGQEINREEYRLPIYIGKAEPSGWRQSRTTGEEKSGNKLFERLVQHSRSVTSAKNLDSEDFACRLMILEGPVVAMIASVEAALIAMHRPLWNSVIDGFGNHNPGEKRFTGMITQWDALHPGRARAKKMSGEMPDVKFLNRRAQQDNQGRCPRGARRREHDTFPRRFVAVHDRP